jgi:molybdopterin-containing oxidoreductase family membrane subunit
MFEHVFRGGYRYWLLVGSLLALITAGVIAYLVQYNQGLMITGMSRSVAWGLYIAQFTFLVGVAASAVMVVLPHYLHDYHEFGKITILGEFLAIGAVTMCPLFILVDLGQPRRIMNVFLHPTPNSLMFWDTVVVFGYLIINIVISRVMYESERKSVAPPKWIKPLIYLSIPWAVSIHTVTAFLYCGLAGRPFWLTAILAPRFLASAFSAGPAMLIILCLIMRAYTRFDAGEKAIGKLAEIVTYAMVINVFFVLLELFTGLYSDMPHHMHHFEYMYFGLHEGGEVHANLAPWMWTSAILSVIAVVVLLVPKARKDLRILGPTAGVVVLALWIEKGLGLVVTGQTPDELGHVVVYSPQPLEILITLGVYGIGFLIITVLYKVALSIREVETS